MALGRIRPRFRMIVPGTVEEQIALVREAAERPEQRCVSRVVGNHVDITVVKEDRHRWSPCVQLEFRPHGLEGDEHPGNRPGKCGGNPTGNSGETIIDGLIGPHPNVWTMFAFINITIALGGAFGAMLWISQLTLGHPGWGLWTVVGAVVLLCVMYVAAQIGQRFAAEQTTKLMQLVDEALGNTGIGR